MVEDLSSSLQTSYAKLENVLAHISGVRQNTNIERRGNSPEIRKSIKTIMRRLRWWRGLKMNVLVSLHE